MASGKVFRALTSLLVICFLFGVAAAKDEVGSVVAVRGKAVIDRDKTAAEAQVKDNILLNDLVSTFDASRVKMLFIDESVLTLGEKSRVSIKEFVYSKDKSGRSIFNLLDGKMRSVVGRSGFEVHTPTAVAAARGTVILFEVGIRNGKKFATIIAYEDWVLIRSTSPQISGSVNLGPKMMITVIEGEPLPEPVTAPASEIARLLNDTEIKGNEISVPDPVRLPIEEFGLIIDVPIMPRIEQLPRATTPVNINITFP
ncbi:MAG: FecR domain-containing protein [Nitrospirae bacterium]|nr:FecR domain-containing protein [Nitrospirota bacterium]